MKKSVIFLILVISFTLLFSAHDLTINGSQQASVSLGDDLLIEFSFEEAGNSANMKFSVDVPLVDLPDIGLPDGSLVDGGSMDETGIDGLFVMTITASIQPPSGLPLVITVEDNGVEDSATISFQSLDTSYSISGSVTQPGSWGFDMPVYPAIVMSLYNAELVDFENLQNFSELDDFFVFLNDHYLIMELNSFTGSYQINIPDQIENVNCALMSMSLLDFEGSHITPDPQIVEVNGHVEDFNFHYVEPDAYINGSVEMADDVMDEEILITLTQGNEIVYTTFPDENNEFSIPVENGSYNLFAYCASCNPWSQEVTVDGEDVEVLITLLSVPNANNDVEQMNNAYIAAYPNPFQSEIKLRVKNDNKSTPDRIKVYNMKGQLVTILNSKSKDTNGDFVWNGSGFNGEKVANGIYFIKYDNSKGIIGKVMLLK